jgi:hypothetical protein
MPEELHALVIRLLPKPWTLGRFEIRKLEQVLEDAPGFAAAVTAGGVARSPPPEKQRAELLSLFSSSQTWKSWTNSESRLRRRGQSSSKNCRAGAR